MDITKLSSRGQVVIPEDIRKGIKESTPFLVTKINDLIVFKEIQGISKEEIKRLKSIKKAWDDIEAGKGRRFHSVESFLKEFKKW